MRVVASRALCYRLDNGLKLTATHETIIITLHTNRHNHSPMFRNSETNLGMILKGRFKV